MRRLLTAADGVMHVGATVGTTREVLHEKVVERAPSAVWSNRSDIHAIGAADPAKYNAAEGYTLDLVVDDRSASRAGYFSIIDGGGTDGHAFPALTAVDTLCDQLTVRGS